MVKYSYHVCDKCFFTLNNYLYKFIATIIIILFFNYFIICRLCLIVVVFDRIVNHPHIIFNVLHH